MRLKSYFAATVEAAVAEARRELGEEALLVNSRKAPAEARHLGEYEVVFAAGPEKAAGAADAAQPGSEEWRDRLVAEVACLRRQVERAAAALAQSAAAARTVAQQAPGWSEAMGHLIAAGVGPELAADIVERARLRAQPPAPANKRGRARTAARTDAARMRAALASEISERLPVDATLGRPGAARRLVALVGPPGAGKTTTLVKLAVTHGLAARRPAQILTADTARINAAEQLRVCAGILGIGFQVVETPAALGQALEEHSNKELILIDTPGLGPKDVDQGADLAKFLASHPEMDTHLVLTATMKSADLSRAVDRFSIFGVSKLLFTRLDETETCGSILDQALRTARPVSFLGTGQQIPEDLEPASRERIVDLLMGQAQFAAPAAA